MRKLEGYLSDRDELVDSDRIETLKKIYRLWDEIMADKEERIQERLKASELRARAAGAFVYNVNVHGGAPAVVVLSGEAEIKD